MMAKGWSVVLNGVTLSGGDDPCAIGCLTKPPSGMGVPPLRVEDVVYPQRDGVRHFDDWYEPRIITLEDVTVRGRGCPGCVTTREMVSEIVQAWSRHCNDVELVVWTDCESPAEVDRALTGPYGIIGRPRVAEQEWSGQGIGVSTLLLRFDAVDHRMYVLDEDGTPGSGEQCITLTPDTESMARCYPRCYTTGGDEGEPDTLLRTNLHPNPFLGQDGAGWTVDGRDGVTQTVETESGPTIDGRTVAWLGLSFDEGSGDPVVHTNGDGSPDAQVSGGDLPVSVYVLSAGVRTTLGIETDQGTVWGEEFFPGEGWTRLTATLNVPPEATTARLLVQLNGDDIDLSGGDMLGVTGALLGVDGEPFDGDTPDGPERFYDWEEDPYQSASQEWQRGAIGVGGTYCYDTEIGNDDGPVTGIVRGMLCVNPTITLYGQLTNPRIENQTTGEVITYRGTISSEDPPVVINTTDGTATQGGVSRTHLIGGDTRMSLDTGPNTLRLTSFATTDNGHVDICWRAAVLAG